MRTVVLGREPEDVGLLGRGRRSERREAKDEEEEREPKVAVSSHGEER